MATVAVYNLKGGVGKTTTAVNLAWLSAHQSARRTLVWDLDPQGAASFILGDGAPLKQEVRSLFSRGVDPMKLIRRSRFEGIDLLAADMSLRGLDRLLFELDKKRRLARLIEDLSGTYDRIILDCPPGLTETAEQVMRAADVMIVPVIPSALSQRAFDAVVTFMDEKKGRQAPLLPVHSMVDQRRRVHKDVLALHHDWPAIPMASVVEQATTMARPLGAFAPSSPAYKAYAKLWRAIEVRLNQTF